MAERVHISTPVVGTGEGLAGVPVDGSVPLDGSGDGLIGELVVVVGANNEKQTVQVTLGVQGSADDQILTGLSLGQKVLTSTAAPSTGGAGAGPGGGAGGGGFRGAGGGLGGGIGG